MSSHFGDGGGEKITNPSPFWERFHKVMFKNGTTKAEMRYIYHVRARAIVMAGLMVTCICLKPDTLLQHSILVKYYSRVMDEREGGRIER